MRSRRLASAWIPAGLAVAAFALALLQRPGRTTTDTKINLNVDPVGFLGDVASTWTSTGELGHVWGGQYAGYLFPMGPFFAVGHLLGVAPWLVERLWLGLLLALAAWGTVRLLDALLSPERGVAHLVAGAMILLNPYVVIYSNRTSVTLLGYAALPWLLLAVHRGVRDARGWWWPAAFALIVSASGAGVNVAVTAFALLGPALLLLYEPLAGGARWADARGFAVRAGAATLVASLWWMAPSLTQALYGNDFLRFTEQPGTIWSTTSVSESLRLMGFWLSYVGVGYGRVRPYFEDSPVMLFRQAVVVASLLIPALALAGFQWTRRWRYGPFFLALALFGLVVMVAGFPNGTPLRRGLNFTYNHVQAVQFLRTTYKSGPLLALGLACLGGAGAAELWRRVTSLQIGPAKAALRVGVPALGAALLALSTWPLMTGSAVDPQLAWKRIPPAWTHAARDLDRQLPRNTRAVVLPGQLFAFYRWGGTVDPLLPALAKRPVAAPFLVPFADLHAEDMQRTVEALIDQRRLVPGQLPPLLAQLGAGAAVVGSDDDRARSGSIEPAQAAAELGAQGLGRPDRSYGPVSRFAPAPDSLDAPAALPEVRRYDLPRARGIVRVEPAARPTIVDGSAEALADLAAFGDLPGDRPTVYAGDRSPAELRRLVAAEGADVVISDSNRRRAFVASRLLQNVGRTLTASDPVSADTAMLNPFAARGTSGQTVAEYEGLRYVRAPYSPGFAQFPEHRPFAAVDGSVATAWLADSSLEVARRYLEVGFERARDVGHIDVFPYSDGRAIVEALDVNGRRFAVHAGWNRLPVELRGVSSLRVRIAGVRQPRNRRGGAGGIVELRVPGVRVHEWLRPPTLAERALANTGLGHSALTYLFERTTGDDPFARNRIEGPAQDKEALDRGSGKVRDHGDAETALARDFRVPAARAFSAAAWVAVAPETPDHALDDLAGTGGRGRLDSSSRYQNRPRFRASGAFDGDPTRGWVGSYVGGRPAWISWSIRSPVALRSLQLRPLPLDVRFPTRVRLTWPGGATPPLAVAPDGGVRLPRTVRAGSFRLEVVAAAFPAAVPTARRGAAAVGIAEVRGVPGLAPVAAAPGGPVRAPCGSARIRAGGQVIGLRFEADRGAFEDGRPLRAAGCGPPLRLPAGRVRLTSDPGPFRVDLLRLRSAAPAGPAAAPGGGRLVSPGRAGNGRHDGVRVALAGPAWLVLGEGFNRGWRAYCDGRSLGKPQVIDGFANGWRAPRDCRAVHIEFAPNRIALWCYIASALASLVLVGVLLLRRRRRDPQAPPSPLALGDRPRRWPTGRAIGAGLAAGAVLGFCFSIRSGLLIAPAVALILWRGIAARTLIAVAGGLLVIVVPVLYLVIPVRDYGGYNFTYPVERIAAHWVAVAAVVLLIVGLWRTVAARE